MRRFTFIVDDWEQVESPRRFSQTIRDTHATDNVAGVTVWENVMAGSYPVMRKADVDTFLTRNGITLESSYKFDGEVRVTY